MKRLTRGWVASTLITLVLAALFVALAWKSDRAYAGVLLNSQTTVPTAQSLAPIGQVGGLIEALEVQGQYAYVGIGPRLVVWNVTNPAHPITVGQSGVLSDVVRDIELAGNYAYAAVGDGGVQILSIVSPTTPVVVGSITTNGRAVGVAVSGNYACVASIFDDFRIFDISVPASPTETGHYSGIYVAEGVDVVGSYAYVATGSGGLKILDIGDPANPTLKSTFASTYARKVLVSGNHAYLADGYGSPNFVVVNIANPATPWQAGSYAAPGEGYDLALNGSTIYLATWDKGIRIINVLNPADPKEIGFYDTSGRAVGVAVSGGHVYVADDWGGAKVVNVTNPAAPALVYEYHSAAETWDVVVSGNTAYLGDRNNGFYVIDVTDPTAPAIVTYYAQTWGAMSEAYLAVSGSKLFIVDRDRLYVFDVSNPASPSPVATYLTLTDPKGISISGDYAYIADGESGLRVLDIRNPAAISQVGILDTPGDLNDVAISGHYAYLADGTQGLRVVDITNPATPLETGYFVSAGWAGGLAVAGHHAFLSAGFGGLRVINVSNPGTPTEVGHYDQNISAPVAATEGYVYVTASQFGKTLQELDVSDPVTPTVVAEYALPSGSHKMRVSGRGLYVAAGGGGLMVFRAPLFVSLDEVRPHQGRADWANEVNVYGENLDAGAVLRLAASPPSGSPMSLEVTRQSSTHFLAVIPAGLGVGSYDLQVINPDGGQATLRNAYRVINPAVNTLFAYTDELWTGPTAPRTSQVTQMGLTVHRAGGSGDLTNLTVDFYDGDPGAGGSSLGLGTIASLPPNNYTTTSSVNWTPPVEGYHEVYARVNATAPFTVHRSVWVLPPALDLLPPTVDSFSLNGGAINVATEVVTLSIRASDNVDGTGVGWILVAEFDWNANSGEWVRVNRSWLDYTGTPMSYLWTLNWSPGLKALVVWAADRAGNISTWGKAVEVNFIPAVIGVNQGQFQVYDYRLTTGQSLSAQMIPVQGNPDLYVGAPHSSSWLASSTNTGTQHESVGIVATTDDYYFVGVYGVVPSRYGLSVGTGAVKSGVAQPASPQGVDQINLPVLPNGQPPPLRQALPPAPTGYRVYLPIVVR